MGSICDVKCITLIWEYAKLKHVGLDANGWYVLITLDEPNDECSNVYEPYDAIKTIPIVVIVKWDINRHLY